MQSQEPTLSPEESLAATFDLLRLPPVFEAALVTIDHPLTLLITSPEAYLGSLPAFRIRATWSNQDRALPQEFLTSPRGFLFLTWPRRLGAPKPGARLRVIGSRPLLVFRWYPTDAPLYGTRVPDLLLHEVRRWIGNRRALPVQRYLYREDLFPRTLPDALRHPQVRGTLIPLLQRSGFSADQIQALSTGAQ